MSEGEIPDETESYYQRLLDKDCDPYEISEAQSQVDDDISMMSFRTVNQDKYFVPPDADLDLVMDQLMQRKSKAVLKQEALMKQRLD